LRLAVAILLESWDRQDSLRQIPGCLKGRVMFADARRGAVEIEKSRPQAHQLSTIPCFAYLLVFQYITITSAAVLKSSINMIQSVTDDDASIALDAFLPLPF
jgi:hypothetical protein